MTRREWIEVLTGLLWPFCRALGHPKETFTVIVHPSNRFDALTRSQISYLFLRKVSRWPWGAEVSPLDLTGDKLVHREFVQQILQISEEQLVEYWIDQRATRGVAPPIGVADPTTAKRFVAAKPGAIAYIPCLTLDSTVKAIKVDL
jgi:hypothetical protein